VESKEFAAFRKKLKKSQAQVARLLGVSVKAVHSYEQGWRSVPAHVERQMLFLVTRVTARHQEQKPCWEIMNCPDSRKTQCPAWEFNAGALCWFINGTICNGVIHKNWKEKIRICLTCEALAPFL
jgi:transcriptional regulator with XRE-family HTH domain